MCAICDAEILISKEDKKEGRRRVEEEKVIFSIPIPISFSMPINFLGST